MTTRRSYGPSGDYVFAQKGAAMLRSIFQRLGLPLLGASAAALILVTTTALAGSGVGSVFNLGQVNTVNAQSSLTGNPGASPLLKVTGTGTAATIRADAGSGIAINGVSSSGTGQAGQSTTGYGLSGVHTGSTGANSGVYGQTSSTDPASAGVTGRNMAAGPGLQAIVTGANTVPPLKVNSSAKVVNLNADLLDGLDSTGLPYWKLGGNAGTTPGPNFLGTTDNKPLELRVNGSRVLRLEPDLTSPNLIGGLSDNGNPTGNGAIGITIGGGGESGFQNYATDDFGTVGGGAGNVAGDIDANPGTAQFATVAGGFSNNATGDRSSIGGGRFNFTSGQYSVIAGGDGNTAGGGSSSSVLGGGGNTASGIRSTVTGGAFNMATGTDAFVGNGISNTASGDQSAVLGGRDSVASGQYSFAAGRRAKANDMGSFVWGDSQAADINSSGTDTFTVRAQNGSFFKGDVNLSLGSVNTAVVAIADGDPTPFVSQGNVFTTANTGNPTITDFDGGAAGQTITIVFGDATTTVQDSGHLHLNGNFTPSADDTLTLVNTNGTDWYEVSRSAN
jgi:hypothetical protein